MITCIFTLDYEIYGNGEGSLQELVYEPARELIEIFRKHDARFVAFVEASELEVIEAEGSDGATQSVSRQIKGMYGDGFEIGLHLHPQWYNAKYDSGRWQLDYSEYNLCTLPLKRITEIVERSISYLRRTLNDRDFTPISFRAGNWLFQPTEAVASVLADNGVKIDSSVFKGGLQRRHGLDYRRALKNGYHWRFGSDANIEEKDGRLVELPIYTKMEPFWRLLTAKRVGLQRKSSTSTKSGSSKVNRLLDYLRPFYPLKLDFCRMTRSEVKAVIDHVVADERRNPESLKPVVAIGHTKDLIDTDTVDFFLSYLKSKEVKVTTFKDCYRLYQ